MHARVRFLGHPVHQMLVVFPLGLLATAVVFDIIYLAGGNPVMAAVSYWLIAAGLVGGVLAAPFGTLDWLAIPSGTRAKRIGAMHGGGNVLVLLLFASSFLLRDRDYAPQLGQMVWAFAGAALAMVTAWLGGELVDRLGIGVDEDAGMNAPSSLHKRHAAVGK
ncbi:DUF2231 domain-containing protein [Variovorax paradoxus]|uniref:DUF2231 domain-containing protein n=1 Tax=Variovorax paradoxus TaxID=34073 RepID=UPI0029C7AA0B|nr:DUF2231 domain-containing protein [Variovorax paradoxus]